MVEEIEKGADGRGLYPSEKQTIAAIRSSMKKLEEK